MYYPAKLSYEDGVYLVTFRDVPEAITVGDDEQQAQQAAVDVLIAHFGCAMHKREPIAKPSPLQDGEQAIYLPASMAAKITLYQQMLEQHITKAELARRLDCNQKQIDRLWDLKHSSKIEMLEKAFAALNKRLQFTLA